MKEFLKVILYKPLFNILILLVFLMPNHNVGLAIIVLTILVRLALLPSSLKAARQQKRMQELQPEIAKIQQTYKDDKQKQSQELMEFYRKNNINPLGSCLPILVQLPILIILYYVFINGLSTARFDLLYSFTPRPDFLDTMFLGLDLAKPDKWILPIIAAVLQFYQGWQTMPKGKVQEGQEMQSMISKQMVILLPIMTLFIAGRFPAALPLYWIITTAFMIAQQWWVNRTPSEFKNSNLKFKNDGKTITKKGVEITVRRKGE